MRQQQNDFLPMHFNKARLKEIRRLRGKYDAFQSFWELYLSVNIPRAMNGSVWKAMMSYLVWFGVKPLEKFTIKIL